MIKKTNLTIWEKRAIAEHLKWYKGVTTIRLNKRQTAIKNKTNDNWYIEEIEKENLSQEFHTNDIKVSQVPDILNKVEVTK